MVKPSYATVVARAGSTPGSSSVEHSRITPSADTTAMAGTAKGLVPPVASAAKPVSHADGERVGGHEDVGGDGRERTFGVRVHAASMVTVRVVSSDAPPATLSASPMAAASASDRCATHGSMPSA